MSTLVDIIVATDGSTTNTTIRINGVDYVETDKLQVNGKAALWAAGISGGVWASDGFFQDSGMNNALAVPGETYCLRNSTLDSVYFGILSTALNQEAPINHPPNNVGQAALSTYDPAGLILLLPGDVATFTMAIVPFTNPLQQVIPVTISQNCPCVRSDATVQLADGTCKAIADLSEEDMLVDYRGAPVALCRCVRMPGKSVEFVCLERDALAPAQPSEDLYIRAGHPVLYEWCEIPVEQLVHCVPGVSEALCEPAPVYTLVTQERTFVQIQGVSVGTWSAAAWEQLQNK